MSDLQVIKNKFESISPLMNERLRRLWAATEARAIGWGGISRVAAATGLSPDTISIGLRELITSDVARNGPTPPNPQDKSSGDHSLKRIRRSGGGAKRIEIKNPAILSTLEQLLADEVAGDPMSNQRWIRSSLRNLSKQLASRGYSAGPGTVARLLKILGFSLKANQRKKGRSGKCPERDEQFRYIAQQRQCFLARGLPLVSVDSKKKELIGNFRKEGESWCRTAPEVDEHDFPSQAECRATPFGIYDVTKNTGYVVVGMSHNTPEFAVRAIERWWLAEGQVVYPAASHLLILADCGGGNGRRVKAWKVNLQEEFCNRYGLTVTVCHYPTGCSKWNPIEHRLFSQISRNWAGKPLRTLGIMLAYIRGTTTTTGLRVEAALDESTYRKEQRVTDEDYRKVSLKPHTVCPDWNYTISPVLVSSIDR